MSENKQEKKDSWLKVLFRYTDGSERRMGLSVILSIISVIGGLVPYYCIYRGADLYLTALRRPELHIITDSGS